MKLERAAALRILRFAVAATILWILFRRIPWSEVRDSLVGIRGAPAIGALACGILLQLLVGLRWREILARHDLVLRRAETLRIHFSALFYSTFLPAGNVAALVVRVLRIEDRSRNWTTILHSLLIDRFWATGILAIWGLAGLLLSGDDPGFAAYALFGTVTLLCAAVLALLSGYPGWKPALILSLFSHGLGVAAYTLLAEALGLDVGVQTLAWIRSATILATMIPVSIMGIGVRESVLVYLLAPHGVESSAAVAFSFLVLAATVLGPSLGGGVIEIERLLTKKKR